MAVKKAVGGGGSKKGKEKAKAQELTSDDDLNVEAEPLASSPAEEEERERKEKVVKVDRKGKGREVPEKDKWDGKKPVQAELTLHSKPKPQPSTSSSLSKPTKPLPSTSTIASSSKAKPAPTTPRPASSHRFIDEIPSSSASSVHTSDTSLDLPELPRGIKNYNRASPGTKAKYIRQVQKDLERDTILYEKRAKREKEQEEREEEARKRLEENAKRIQEEARNRPSSSPIKMGQLAIGVGGKEGMVGVRMDDLTPAQIQALAAVQENLNGGFDADGSGGSSGMPDITYGGLDVGSAGGVDGSQGGGGALAGPSKSKLWRCSMCDFDVSDIFSSHSIPLRIQN